MFPKSLDIDLPQSITEAVDTLLDDLPLLERSQMAHMTENELDLVNRLVGVQIARDFRLWSGNDDLLHACMQVIDDQEDDDLDPTMVIVRAMWQQLQETHVLRVVR